MDNKNDDKTGDLETYNWMNNDNIGDDLGPYDWAAANERNRISLGLTQEEYNDAALAAEALWQVVMNSIDEPITKGATERWDYIIRVTLDTLKKKLWGGAKRTKKE